MLGSLLNLVVIGSAVFGSNRVVDITSHLKQIENAIEGFDYNGNLQAYKDLINVINNKVGIINHAKLSPEELKKARLKFVSLMDGVIAIAELKKVESPKLEELKGSRQNLVGAFGLEREVALLDFFGTKNHKKRKDAFTSLVLHGKEVNISAGVPGSFTQTKNSNLLGVLEKLFKNKKNMAKWLVESLEVRVKKEGTKVIETKEPLIILLIREGRFETIDILLDYCTSKYLKLNSVISNDGKSIFQLYMEADQPQRLLNLINKRKINTDSQVPLKDGMKRHIAFDLLYKIASLDNDNVLRKQYIEVLDKLISNAKLEEAFDIDGEHFLLKLYSASFEIEELKDLFEKLRIRKASDSKAFGELRLNERAETLAHVAIRKKDKDLLEKLPANLFEGTRPYMFALISGDVELEAIVHKKVKAATMARAIEEAKKAFKKEVLKPRSIDEYSKDVKVLVDEAKEEIAKILGQLNALPIDPAKDNKVYDLAISEVVANGHNVIKLSTIVPLPMWYNEANRLLVEAKQKIDDAVAIADSENLEAVKVLFRQGEERARAAVKKVAVYRADLKGLDLQISKTLNDVKEALKNAAAQKGAPAGFSLQISEAIKKAEEALKNAAVLKLEVERIVNEDKKIEVERNAEEIVKAAEAFYSVHASTEHRERNKDGVNLLMAAAAGGNLQLVNKFIKNEDFLKARDSKGASVLHYVGSPEVLKVLLDKQVDQPNLSSRFEINHQDSDGFTPLMRAVAAGKLEVVEAFVKAGANVNICTKAGISPLIQACLNKDTEMVGLLLSSPQIDVNYKMNSEGSSLSAIEMVRYLRVSCHLEFHYEPGQDKYNIGTLNSSPKLPELYNEERQKLDSITTLLLDHNADKAALTDPKITIENQKNPFLIFYHVVLKTAFRQSLGSILNLLLLGTKDNPLYTLSDTANKLLFTTEANQHLADTLFVEIMTKMPGWQYKYPPKPNATGMGFKIERRYFLPVLTSNEEQVVSVKGILSFIWEDVLSFSNKNSHVVDFDPRRIKFINRFFPSILKKAESTGESVRQSEESKESLEGRKFKLWVGNSPLDREKAILAHEELLVRYMQLKEEIGKRWFILGAKAHLLELAKLDREMLKKQNLIYDENNPEEFKAGTDRGAHNTHIRTVLASLKNANRKKLLNILILKPAEYKSFIELVAMIRNRKVIVAVDDYYEIIKFERELERKKADVLGNSKYSYFKKAVFNISNRFANLLGFELGCGDCKVINIDEMKPENKIIFDASADERINYNISRSLVVWMIDRMTGNNLEVNVRKVSKFLGDLSASASTKIAFASLSSRMANVIAFFSGVVSALGLPYIVTATYWSFGFAGVYGVGKGFQYTGIIQSLYNAANTGIKKVFGSESNYKIIETEEDKRNIGVLNQLQECDINMPGVLDIDEQVTSVVHAALGVPAGSKIAHNAWGGLASLPPIILGLSGAVLFGLLAVNEIRQAR